MKKTHQQLARNANETEHGATPRSIEQLRMDPSIKQFLVERDRALLSLDETTIRAHSRKWQVRTSDDPNIFWISVHKARTACLSLPREARLVSKMWLMARGYQSLDDGDLELEIGAA